jgi:hypothetical protein
VHITFGQAQRETVNVRQLHFDDIAHSTISDHFMIPQHLAANPTFSGAPYSAAWAGPEWALLSRLLKDRRLSLVLRQKEKGQKREKVIAFTPSARTSIRQEE